MAKVKVRLSLRPDEDWEVDEDELPGLRTQGLLAADGTSKADEEAAEREAARQRAAEERAAAKASRDQKAGE